MEDTQGSIHKKPGPYYSGTGRDVTEAQWATYLEVYATCGLIGKAAHSADMTRETVRRRRNDDEAFAALEQEALDDYRELVAQEVHRRAVEGVEEPVYQKGELCGSIVRYSDRLLELHVKRHIPEYRDKISVAANVTGGVLVVPGQVTNAEDWEAQYGEASRGAAGAKD